MNQIIKANLEIVRKEILNPTVTLMEVSAPYVARKAEAGQFIILRVDKYSIATSYTN